MLLTREVSTCRKAEISHRDSGGCQAPGDWSSSRLSPSSERRMQGWCSHSSFFKKDFTYLLLERGEGREKEREREKHQCVVASCAPPTGDLAHNPGMCPYWELKQWPFGLQVALNPLSHTSQGYLLVFKTNEQKLSFMVPSADKGRWRNGHSHAWVNQLGMHLSSYK